MSEKICQIFQGIQYMPINMDIVNSHLISRYKSEDAIEYFASFRINAERIENIKDVSESQIDSEFYLDCFEYCTEKLWA